VVVDDELLTGLDAGGTGAPEVAASAAEGHDVVDEDTVLVVVT